MRASSFTCKSWVVSVFFCIWMFITFITNEIFGNLNWFVSLAVFSTCIFLIPYYLSPLWITFHQGQKKNRRMKSWPHWINGKTPTNFKGPGFYHTWPALYKDRKPNRQIYHVIKSRESENESSKQYDKCLQIKVIKKSQVVGWNRVSKRTRFSREKPYLSV